MCAYAYTCACVCADYAVEQEHTGLRSVAGYGVSLTRGTAAVMNFTFSLILATMCRNIITLLRGTIISQYVPFDSHVTFHKIVAYTALVAAGNVFSMYVFCYVLCLVLTVIC